MREVDKRRHVHRRVFLRGAATTPAAAAIAAAGLTIGPDAAWAADLKAVKPAMSANRKVAAVSVTSCIYQARPELWVRVDLRCWDQESYRGDRFPREIGHQRSP